jgi:hypothetical protein
MFRLKILASNLGLQMKKKGGHFRRQLHCGIIKKDETGRVQNLRRRETAA